MSTVKIGDKIRIISNEHNESYYSVGEGGVVVAEYEGTDVVRVEFPEQGGERWFVAKESLEVVK